MKAEEEADAFENDPHLADNPQAREKWLKTIEMVAELQAEWEEIMSL